MSRSAQSPQLPHLNTSEEPSFIFITPQFPHVLLVYASLPVLIRVDGYIFAVSQSLVRNAPCDNTLSRSFTLSGENSLNVSPLVSSSQGSGATPSILEATFGVTCLTIPLLFYKWISNDTRNGCNLSSGEKRQSIDVPFCFISWFRLT